MTEPSSIEQLGERIAELKRLQRELSSASSGGNAQTITVNAGNAWLTGLLMGVALISSVCCGISVGLAFSLSRDLERQQADVRQMTDYVQALYRQVPELRKIAEKEQAK